MIDYLLNIQLFSYMQERTNSTQNKNYRYMYIEIRKAWAYCVLTATGEVRTISFPKLVIQLYKPATIMTGIKHKYSETCLNRTLSKLKTCLNQTVFRVPSTKYLFNLNLCKPNTCLNRTNSSFPKGFGLDRFYCNINSQTTSLVGFL